MALQLAGFVHQIPTGIGGVGETFGRDQFRLSTTGVGAEAELGAAEGDWIQHIYARFRVNFISDRFIEAEINPN